jgi:hypothetical protein
MHPGQAAWTCSMGTLTNSCPAKTGCGPSSWSDTHQCTLTYHRPHTPSRTTLLSPYTHSVRFCRALPLRRSSGQPPVVLRSGVVPAWANIWTAAVKIYGTVFFWRIHCSTQVSDSTCNVSSADHQEDTTSLCRVCHPSLSMWTLDGLAGRQWGSSCCFSKAGTH